MMNLIYDQQERLIEWAAERAAIDRFRDDAKAIALMREDQIVAVVVYDNFSDSDCNMHIASDGSRRWMNKSLLLAAFAYPFVQLNYPRVTGLVPESNLAAIEFDKHIGFVEEGRHPLAYKKTETLISLGLLRSTCRFIALEHRK